MLTNEQINEIEAMCENFRAAEEDKRKMTLELAKEYIDACMTLLPQLAADYRKAMEERRWISVSERLPEEVQVVLVSGTSENDLRRKGYECGWLINGDWTCWFTKNITHWMPLPAPPEGGR